MTAHPANDLSFMKPRMPKGTGIDYWLIKPTGSYGLDCEAGKELAEEYLTYLGEHPTLGNSTLLTCIVREMIDRAKAGAEWSGVSCRLSGQREPPRYGNGRLCPGSSISSREP